MTLSFDERAAGLLARLTDDEKIAMLHQFSPAVPRLGIAAFVTGTEGLHGASWRDHGGTGLTLPATVFPQPAGLGATWDPDLVRDVAQATAREIRALHDQDPRISLNVWAPVVNLLRDPRWGRNEEGYSEDPLLTGLLATAFCRGLAGDRADGYLLTAPTLKHFLGYNNEDFRDLTSSALRPRVLHEYDLPPFRAPIEAGLATGVMPSYNLVNGRPAHVSPLLRLIRTWTDEELLTCSDAWAPSNLVNTEHYFDDHAHAYAAALRAGLDSFTDADSDGTFTATAIRQALGLGLITMADVDRAVRRKLLIRLRLGEFDADGGPYVGAGALGTPEHRDLSRTAARRSMVLLRNDGNLLPISSETTIALIGPLADTLYEDWYSPALPYQVTIADGLKAVTASVTVDEAAERVRTDLGEFDVFDWGDGIVTLRAAENGKYLTVTRSGALAVEAGKPDGWTVRETFRRARMPGGDMLLRSTATGVATRLRWDVIGDGITGAVARAREADVAVVVVGNNPLIGGREAVDRTTLELPPSMDRLIREVTAANPRTIVVIMSSYPYLTPGAPGAPRVSDAPAAPGVPGVPAIMWIPHAGQETGHALADLLTGRHAPEGRLPQTWYASDADLPGPLDYDIIKSGWTYQYSPAVPRFPFGHGLTYTRFSYGSLTLSPAGPASPASSASSAGSDPLVATLPVTNTGGREGTEVVQLYASYEDPHRPRRRLCGFARVTLAPGETRTVEVSLPMSRLALWDVVSGRMTVPPGPIEIMAAASSADIRQTATLTVPGAPPLRDLAVRQAAAGFDDYENIILVDTTREDGDAVTPANPADRSWLVFKNSILNERAVVSAFRVSCAAPGGGRIEVRHGRAGGPAPDGPGPAGTRPDGPGPAGTRPDGPGPAGTVLLGEVLVPCTGGRYEWTEVTARLEPTATSGASDPAKDLYLILHGPIRLDWFELRGA
ncbi:MAG TPA: glycoside hydrolase family 3 C-terminal domain-containing protein [Streptosporangiaceae bacterium]